MRERKTKGERATDDEMTIHFENSGKEVSLLLSAQYLHHENTFHLMFTTCACDDVEGSLDPYSFFSF